jgi:hypothetical protein
VPAPSAVTNDVGKPLVLALWAPIEPKGRGRERSVASGNDAGGWVLLVGVGFFFFFFVVVVVVVGFGGVCDVALDWLNW